jgi:hypothetical protein
MALFRDALFGISTPTPKELKTTMAKKPDSASEEKKDEMKSLRFKLSEPVDCDIAVLDVYKSAKEYLKNGDFTRSWGANEADVGWDVFNKAEDMTQIAVEVISDASGLDPEKDMEKLIAVGKKWEDFVVDENLPSLRQYYQDDLTFIKDEGILKKLAEDMVSSPDD